MSITTIDCGYLRPQFAAAFLLVENGRALFIENNTAHATPLLLEALEKQKISPDCVDYLIITHVHLDHAGGTSELLKHCPNATVLAHPKAAKRVIDPTKLIDSATQVYGAAYFKKMYGNIEAIPANRVRAMVDGEELRFGSRILRFFYTLGHASHHFCIHDSASNGVFTGDSFGLCYPALQQNGLFIFPSTSPVDFDPMEAQKSLNKIIETGAKRLYLTHFGELTQIYEAKNQLQQHLDFHAQLLAEAQLSEFSGAALSSFCEEKLAQHFESTLKRMHILSAEAWSVIKLDVELNGQGIAFVAEKLRKNPA